MSKNLFDYIATQIAEGSLHLDNNQVPEFSSLTNALPKQLLILTNARMVTSSSEVTRIEGKINILNNSNLPSTLEITNIDPIKIELTAQLPLNWTWTDTFSNLPGSYRQTSSSSMLQMGETLLSDFQYVKPRWILTNYRDTERAFQTGLNFSATALLNNFRSGLSEVFNWTESIQLTGNIKILPQSELSPIVELKLGSSKAQLSVGPILIRDLDVYIRTTDPLSPIKKETFLEVIGNAVLDESTVQRVSSILSSGNQVFRIRGEAPDNSVSLGISGLVKLFGGEESELLLPSNFSSLGNIHFKSFDASLNLSRRELEFIGIEVGSDKTWSPIPNLLPQITDIVLNCLVYWPMKPKYRSLFLQVGGRLILGSTNPVELYVYASKNEEYALYGYLAGGQTITLKSLASEYVSATEELPNIEIYSLNFYALPTAHSYSIEAGLKSDWTLNIGLGKNLILRNTTFQLKKFGTLDDFNLIIKQFKNHNELPDLGRSLVIVAKIGNFYHVRIFNRTGKKVKDLGKKEFIPSQELISKFDNWLGQSIDDRTKIELLRNIFSNLDFKPREIAATLEVQFEIAGSLITLYADNPSGDDGWTFKGQAYNANGLTVSNLLDSLKQILDLDDSESFLPETIKNISFRNPGIILNTKTKHFALTCEVRLPADPSVYPAGEINVLLQFAYNSPEKNPKDPQKNETKKQIYVGWSISSIDLANLPLVKDKIPSSGKLAINYLHMYRSTGRFKQEALDLLNELNTSYFAAPTISTLEKGLKLNADIFIDTVQQRLSFPVDPEGNPTAPPIVTGGAAQDVAVADGVVWFSIGKLFGPVSFERIGITYKKNAISFLLDASLRKFTLNLSLLGLKASVSFEKFEPRFELQGLGLAYEIPPIEKRLPKKTSIDKPSKKKTSTDRPAIEIGGTFLRGLTEIDGETYESFSGAAFIKTHFLTFSAIGSYILAEQPSLLIFGLIDFPVAGEPFFLITGVAAGFGYNRRLKQPPLYRLAEFPLISAALNPSTSSISAASEQPTTTISSAIDSSTSSSVALELRKLAPYIPPATGEYFLAIGVKFISFKIIESFALLTVSAGESFRMDVLGISRAVFPSKAPGQNLPEIARVEIAFQAVFAPEEGYIGVRGQLTPNSFLFSSNCRLAGGFAFYSWFSGENAGDFVQTLGGYHPSFIVPPHYPRVPRLAFNWNVDNRTSIKGSLYYALTGRALMAGGHLEAAFEDGDFRAWFRLGVDFLIAWKPFAYEARSRVNIGASYTFKVFGIRNTVSVDVGADLHIWGPEFGGKAKVYVLFFSFDVEFGARTRSLPKPIDWNEFKGSFLPAEPEICGITVKDGLVTKEKGANSRDLGVLNAKNIALVTNSAIPAWEGGKKEGQRISAPNRKFGIAPMGKKAVDISEALHIVEIKKDNLNVEDRFKLQPIYKNVTTALWGESLTPANPNETKMIPDVLSGFEIRPAQPPSADATPSINAELLIFEPDVYADAFSWQELPPREVDKEDNELDREARINATILAQDVAAKRQSLLEEIGIDDPFVELKPSVESRFIFAPQIEKRK